MGNERKELVKHLAISGVAACVIVLGLAVTGAAYQRYVDDQSWANALADDVDRHGLSYLCRRAR
jgi:hypothetical protein